VFIVSLLYVQKCKIHPSLFMYLIRIEYCTCSNISILCWCVVVGATETSVH